MEIRLSDILSVPNRVEEMDVAIDMAAFKNRGISYEITDMSPVHLRLTNLGSQRLHLEAQFMIEIAIPCDRCLTDVKHRYEIQVDNKLDVDKSEDDEDLDDINYMKEYQLDIDMLVYEEISVRLPMKNLCKEDCKGICSVCGANLNHKECGCDRKVADPRMSDVLDIFNNYFKEV